MVKLNLQKQTLEKLKALFGSASCGFLGFTLDWETGTLTDALGSTLYADTSNWQIQALAVLLTHYSTINPTARAGKLVKFRDLPGGYAYEEAFVKRAITTIANAFGEKPEELLKAAKRLGGTPLCHGDASAEIPALKGICLTYVLWGKEEFPASANILYDQSASNYLPTEDLAVLGELTSARLIEAKTKK